MGLALSESAVSKLPYYLFLIDPDYNISYLNNNFCKYLDKTVDKILGLKFSDLFEEDVKAGIDSFFNNKLVQEGGYKFESFINYEKNQLVFEWTINSFNDTEKTEYIVTASNITQKRKTEDSFYEKINYLAMLYAFNAGIQEDFSRQNILKELESLFAAFSHNVDRTSILLYDEKTQTLVEERVEGLQNSDDKVYHGIKAPPSISALCYKKNRVVYIPDCSITDLIPAQFINEMHLVSTLAVPINNKNKQIGVLRLDSTQKKDAFSDFDMKFFKYFADQIGFFFEYSNVITDLKEKERLIMESEQMYRLLVSSLPEIIFVHKNGTLVFVNESVKDILGYTCDEVIGTNVLNYVTPKSRLAIIENMNQRRMGVHLRDYQASFIHKNGSSQKFIVRGNKISYKNEDASLVVLMQVDD